MHAVSLITPWISKSNLFTVQSLWEKYAISVLFFLSRFLGLCFVDILVYIHSFVCSFIRSYVLLRQHLTVYLQLA